MILAAGYGKRLRPLTDSLPKPLVEVHGKPLIVYHLERAAACGIQDVVINVGHLGQQIIQRLGDGEQWGVNIQYSIEPRPLETAGGLVFARRWLGQGSFLLVNADIYHEMDFGEFIAQPRQALHLMMVPNPAERPQGDFHLDPRGLLGLRAVHDQPCLSHQPCLTYGGMGIYTTEFVESIDSLRSADPQALRTPFYLQRWMQAQKVSGAIFSGLWCDVGTTERLDELRQNLKTRQNLDKI